jgi:predicted nucleic acid-binding protein
MFLLDTNVLSELRRPDKANPGLIAWAKSTVPAELFISAITLFEIELGAVQAAWEDAVKGKVLRSWIDTQVMPAFKGRIIAVDAIVAQRCAALHVPDPRPQRDSLIAATALVHRMTVITRNVRDFEPMGVQLVNPWLDE